MENSSLPDFPCTGCGECCRRVDKVLGNDYPPDSLIGKLVKVFPYKADSQGHCEMLVDGKCSVYETRPLLCNIKRMTEVFYKDNPLGHYLDCAYVCNALIDSAGLSPDYLINIEELREQTR